MQLSCSTGATTLTTDSYVLTFPTDRPFVYLSDIQGKRQAELFALSGVHPLHDRDDCLRVGTWKIDETPQEVVFSLEVDSSVWERKTIRLRCWPHRFTYEIEVEGRGQLCEVDYFGGYSSASLRWGSGFFWSGQKFSRGFTPEPNTDEMNYFSPKEGAAIDLMGVPLPGRGDWFFTPPPFFFGFEGQNGWVGMGIEARPGEHNFTEYAYHTRGGAFYLSLAYEGYTSVSGMMTLPAIGFDFGAGEFEVLSAHTGAVRLERSPLASGVKPAWWYEPIFCGWGAQCYAAGLENGKAPAYSRQSLYETFLARLEENGIRPGTVVLDDKWQLTYGENQADEAKWPDLPAFVREQHARGRKVLLWLKAWDPEGVPAEECITNRADMSVAVDPTNPAFERRLRQSVQRMLSTYGYDADGFKIDFTARIPSGPGMKTYGPGWGLELMKQYLYILYDEAKQVKPDALVMTHTPHPYLADVLDMVRLNDINAGCDVNQAMALRARVASIACPDAIIDTDNWPIPNKTAWKAYLAIQPDLGVPSLYYAGHIDGTKEPMELEDYRLIRDAWDRHRANLDRIDDLSVEVDSS